MKVLLLLFIPFIYLNSNIIAQKDNLPQSKNTFMDSRDGEIYRIVTFNNDLGMSVRKKQTWLAENLRYEIKGSSWWYDNNRNSNIYGRLYTFNAAKIACPKGWRLPTDLDWQILMHQLSKGRSFENAARLYEELLVGINRSNFNALLGGNRDEKGKFHYLNRYGYYWSETKYSIINSWGYLFNSDKEEIDRLFFDENMALSCRCIKKD